MIIVKSKNITLRTFEKKDEAVLAKHLNNKKLPKARALCRIHIP